MRPIDIAKIALALCAAILLGWGMRVDNNVSRWAGIGCLVLAVALRFVGRKRPLD